MKFTLGWLKEHLDTDAPLDAITDRLTALGLEVEKVEDRAAQYAPFFVAYVEKADKHPDADRLRVCIVDTGKGKVQGRVRRAQCAGGHEGRVRAREQLYPRHAGGAEKRRDPGAGILRHAGVRAGDGLVRGP